MTTRLPPKYIPAEDRPARIAELERLIAREWLRFAIIDGLYVVVAVGIVVALVLSDAISEGVQAPVATALALPIGALVLYWTKVRVQPLQREPEQLRALDVGV